MGAAESSTRQLRFGVLCNGKQLAGWQIDCIAALEKTGSASAALLIVGASPCAPAMTTSPLWRLYSKTMLERSAAARLQDLPARLANLPTASADMSDRTWIREHALDFILDFSQTEVPVELAAEARLGVWTFRFGDQAKNDDMPPGFWDTWRGEAVTQAALIRIDAQGGGERLRDGVFKTEVAFFNRTREQILRAAAMWPAQVSRTWDDGRNAPPERLPPQPPAPRRGPSNLETIRFLVRQVGGLVGKVHRRLFRHQLWRVGIIDAPVQEVAGLTGTRSGSGSIRWLPNPEGRFLADPFAIEAEGGLLLLAEDYRWTTGLGMISGLRLSGERASEPQTVFDLPVHMSYPYLFRHGGHLHCVPETNEAREAALYVVDEQTLQWTKSCVLVGRRRLADSTIVEWNGRWWLFATDIEDDQVLNLYAWHAPELEGPWEEHAANPVKTDVRSSRPAGRPFVYKGDLYRPAQDCSEVYGGAVAVNRVVELTPTHFQEEVVRVIRPQPDWPGRDGLHHLCGVGDQTVIDACETVFVWQATASEILRKLRR